MHLFRIKEAWKFSVSELRPSLSSRKKTIHPPPRNDRGYIFMYPHPAVSASKGIDFDQFINQSETRMFSKQQLRGNLCSHFFCALQSLISKRFNVTMKWFFWGGRGYFLFAVHSSVHGVMNLGFIHRNKFRENPPKKCAGIRRKNCRFVFGYLTLSPLYYTTFSSPRMSFNVGFSMSMLGHFSRMVYGNFHKSELLIHSSDLGVLLFRINQHFF